MAGLRSEQVKTGAAVIGGQSHEGSGRSRSSDLDGVYLHYGAFQPAVLNTIFLVCYKSLCLWGLGSKTPLRF
jgi:hypothetical protein